MYDTAGASVFARQANGVALTSLGNPALVQDFGPETFSNWNSTGKSSCSHALQSTPTAPGDYVATMQHDTTIPAGGSVTFRVGYRLL